MLQAKACTEIAKFAKEQGFNIWCWTGFTFEELLEADSEILAFLNCIDVLVDGKYEEAKRTFTLKFRGSSNQRLIDAPKSMKKKKAVEIEEKKADMDLAYGKVDHMYI